MRIVALDLSLTSTGIAKSVGGGPPALHIATSGYAGTERLCDLRREVMYHVASEYQPDVVVIEGYAYGRPEKAHQLGELGGVIRVAIHELRPCVPVAVIPPAKVKKYATGTGNAKKDQVFAAAIHRSGLLIESTDAADAWWLWQMAAAHYGAPHVQMPAANRSALDTVDWPDLNQEVPA